MSLPISLLLPLVGMNTTGVYCKVCAQAYVDGFIRPTPEAIKAQPYRAKPMDMPAALAWATDHLQKCPTLRRVLEDQFDLEPRRIKLTPEQEAKFQARMRLESQQQQNGQVNGHTVQQPVQGPPERPPEDADIQTAKIPPQARERPVENEVVPQFADPKLEREGLLRQFGGSRVTRAKHAGSEGS